MKNECYFYKYPTIIQILNRFNENYEKIALNFKASPTNKNFSDPQKRRPKLFLGQLAENCCLTYWLLLEPYMELFFYVFANRYREEMLFFFENLLLHMEPLE